MKIYLQIKFSPILGKYKFLNIKCGKMDELAELFQALPFAESLQGAIEDFKNKLNQFNEDHKFKALLEVTNKETDLAARISTLETDNNLIINELTL